MDAGFDVLNPDGSLAASVLWDDVTRIQAYKRDLFTTDCICLLFECGSDQPAVELSEEWQGFSDLLGMLERRFPTIPPSWYVDIMTPAFEARRTVLFGGPLRQG